MRATCPLKILKIPPIETINFWFTSARKKLKISYKLGANRVQSCAMTFNVSKCFVMYMSAANTSSTHYPMACGKNQAESVVASRYSDVVRNKVQLLERFPK